VHRLLSPALHIKDMNSDGRRNWKGEDRGDEGEVELEQWEIYLFIYFN